MKTSDFDYNLPQELIAQTPVEPRDSSRLLVYHRDTGAVEHKIFRDVIDYLNPGDVLVINQTRVIPARLYGVKEGTGGAIDRYNEWQVAALGRDINPDQLRKRILSPSWGENLTGAFRVDVVKPTYKALDDTQVAKFSGHLTVSHKVESEVV